MADKLGEIFVEIKAKTDSLEKEIKGMKSKLDKDAQKMGKSFGTAFDGGLKKILAAGAGLIGLQQAISFGRKILNTASDFEQLRTRLVNLYQDTDKAGKVFDKFKKIAATTPFSLKGVVEAGSTLKAFGVDAENTLKSVTDLAAYMGMDVVEAANAVGRAFAGGAGAADVLRERGVLNLIKEFKGIDDITKLTLPQFRKALIESMQDPTAGIAGATDRMSKTFQGAYSNMGDAIENFSAWLGTKLLPALTSVTRGVGDLFTSLTPTADAFEEANEKAVIQKTKFEQLAGTYLNLKEKMSLTNAEQRILKETIGQLQREYPNYLGNINLEKVGYDEAKTAIQGAREELDKYLASMIKKGAIQANEDKMVELGSKLYQITTKRINAELKLKSLTDAQKKRKGTVYELGNIRTSTGLGTQNQFTDEEYLKTQIQYQKDQIQNAQKEMGDLASETQTIMTELEKIIGAVISPKTEKGGGSGSGGSGIVKQYTDAIEKIKTLGYEMQKLGGKTQLSGVSQKKVANEDRGSNELQNVFEQMTGTGESAYGWADAVAGAADIAQGAMDGFFEDIYIKSEHANSMLEKAFVGMANSFIAQVERMITQWLSFKAIQGLFSLIPGGGAVFSALTAPTAASGGTFQAGSTGITKMASGGSFIVPSGHPTDTYPLLLRSGEKAVITPSHQTGFGSSSSDKILKDVYNRIGALTEVVRRQNNNVTVINNSPDIQSTVVRQKSVENRMSKRGMNFNDV